MQDIWLENIKSFINIIQYSDNVAQQQQECALRQFEIK